jgi:hypothetical protein
VTTLGRDVWPVDFGDRPEHFAVRLAVLPHGAIAAWTSWDGSHLRVLTSTSSGGRFRAAAPVTPAGADYALGDVEASPAGRPALALRSEPVDALSAPFVTFARRDGSFGVPEAVASASAGVGGEALAFNPVTGLATLVWTQTSFEKDQPRAATLASTQRGNIRAGAG